LYEELTNREPQPFDWKFDRAALERLLARIEARKAAACSQTNTEPVIKHRKHAA